MAAAVSIRATFALPLASSSNTQDIANALASAIDNNKNGLQLNPIATAAGTVELNDLPGTIVDVSLAPTLSTIGVPRWGDASPDSA